MIRRSIVTDAHLALTLGPLCRGSMDPTMRLGNGEAWRAGRTPEGPVTLHCRRSGGAIDVTAWGPGAPWALDRAPALLGALDEPEAFRPAGGLLRELHRRMPGLRLGRTDVVIEALVPSIIEQKVAGMEAWRAYARLVRTHGEPAPGPAGLFVPPEPAALAALPSYAYHPLGIERRRADTVRGVCSRPRRVQEAATMPREDARRRLMAFPGVGAWTAAEVTRTALGDPDAVSVGDFHVPHVVSWALAGEPRGSDERMLELLEPYRGQRARAVRLLEAAGIGAPRFGPRMPLRSIARI